MLPLSIGLAMAVGFALLTGSVYGLDALAHGGWSVLVLWGLVAGPALMWLVSSDDRRRGPRRG
jgi:hypothetical protein